MQDWTLEVWRHSAKATERIDVQAWPTARDAIDAARTYAQVCGETCRIIAPKNSALFLYTADTSKVRRSE